MVRWVEVVIASPYLTTMVQYYEEGHVRQRHHLANERRGENERAMASRGNVFAYHMLWEMVLACASQCTSGLIKALFKNTTEERTVGHLKELHIQSFVYSENGHEDIAEWLLRNKADPYLRDKHRVTPYATAEELGMKRVADEIRKKKEGERPDE